MTPELTAYAAALCVAAFTTSALFGLYLSSLLRRGERTNSIRWYVDVDDDEIGAYPHGERQAQVFNTIEEAHAYLTENGSESPWEVGSPRSEQIHEKAKAKLQAAKARGPVRPGAARDDAGGSMTTLRLREGWEVNFESGLTVFKRSETPSVFAYVIILPKGYIRAYRFGEFGLHSRSCHKTIEEAHAYLIEKGGESPWEEV